MDIPDDGYSEILSKLGDLDLNSELLNLYRGAKNSMDWHSDSEREIGPNPMITSVSLGQTRTFEIRHREPRKTVRL